MVGFSRNLKRVATHAFATLLQAREQQLTSSNRGDVGCAILRAQTNVRCLNLNVRIKRPK